VEPLTPATEGPFLEFINGKPFKNYHAFLDLRLQSNREKTKFWIALEGTNVVGYMLEYDRKSITLRGDANCAVELLDKTNLDEPYLNVEPEHLRVVEKIYEPVKPSYKFDRGKVTTFLVMEVNRESFRPIIVHDPKKLTNKEFDDIVETFMRLSKEIRQTPAEHEQIARMLNTDLRHRIFYGTYEGGKLVSLVGGGPSPVAENLSEVRPVYTYPEFRERGHATSACSAVVDELLSKTERVTLAASRSNAAALRVYEKIGFSEIYRFLTFWGRRVDARKRKSKHGGNFR